MLKNKKLHHFRTTAASNLARHVKPISPIYFDFGEKKYNYKAAIYILSYELKITIRCNAFIFKLISMTG